MEPVSREQSVGRYRQLADRVRDRNDRARDRLRADRIRDVDGNERLVEADREQGELQELQQRAARLRDLMRLRDNRLVRNIDLAVNGERNPEPREREGRGLQGHQVDWRRDVPRVPLAELAGGLMNPEQPQVAALRAQVLPPQVVRIDPRHLDPLGGQPVMFLGERNGRRGDQPNQRMQEIERDHADRVGRLNALGVALEDAERLRRERNRALAGANRAGAENRRVFQQRLRAEHGPLFRQATIPSDDDDCGSQVASTTINVSIEGDVISYTSAPDQPSSVGLFIWGKCLKPESNYFEIEILDRGESSFGGTHTISIGVVNLRFPLDTHIGKAVDSESIAYHTGEGILYHGGPRGKPFGERCEIGDKIGCGIRFPSGMKHSSAVSGSSTDGAPIPVQVFFTRNGKELPSDGHNMQITLPPHGFFPAISMNQSGEEVSIKLPGSGVRWAPEEDIMMLVDSAEDDWLRLHDIRLNGPILEYIGRGKSLVDVGLAQAKTPICTRNHYFEIEIVDPGSSCFIAIGLARKDYPKNRHPGWNKGSIAYHADDGKVFVGSGVGAPFGPRCHKGDIMGCGVLFPRNYECKSDSEEELEQQGGVDQYGARAGVVAGIPDRIQPGPEAGGGVVIGHNYVQLDYASDSGEDDDWWNDRNYIQSGVKVEIYFTRNGNVIGKKDIRIPKGGFYPTVGMMSCDEKVRVDLRPLSG